MPTLTDRMREIERDVAVFEERTDNMVKSVDALRKEFVTFASESNLARAKNEAKLDKLLSNGHSKPWIYGTAGASVGGGTGAAAIILIIEKFFGG